MLIDIEKLIHGISRMMFSFSKLYLAAANGAAGDRVRDVILAYNQDWYVEEPLGFCRYENAVEMNQGS